MISQTRSRQQNIDLPAGTLEGSDRDILIRFTEQRRTPHEYADLIVIGGDTGAEIRLGDVATIEDVFERVEDQVRVNGVRAGLLEIKKTKEQDALNVVDSVREFFAEEDKRKPAGVKFTETQDVTTIVRDRLQMLLWNGLQGLILVLVTMWVFFNWRLSMWVTVGLPVSFLGAFFLLPLLGMTINMLSMVALLLALGLLMDDAIVIAENVAARLRGAASAETAAIEGTLQVRNGVLSSFATTACVFCSAGVRGWRHGQGAVGDAYRAARGAGGQLGRGVLDSPASPRALAQALRCRAHPSAAPALQRRYRVAARARGPRGGPRRELALSVPRHRRRDLPVLRRLVREWSTALRGVPGHRRRRRAGARAVAAGVRRSPTPRKFARGSSARCGR